MVDAKKNLFQLDPIILHNERHNPTYTYYTPLFLLH